MDEGLITLELSVDPRAPGRVRRSMEELRRRLDPDVIDTITFLVNELVTNSVKFAGGGAIEVRVNRTGPGSIRVDVLDDGPGFIPSRDRPPLTATSGRGLFLVESLAARWGVSMDGRTCVWFEIG
jgi:two-component sensor histidine kinase